MAFRRGAELRMQEEAQAAVLPLALLSRRPLGRGREARRRLSLIDMISRVLLGPAAAKIRRLRDRPRGWVLLTVGTVVAGAIGWTIDVALLLTLAVGLGVATPIAAACGLIASASVNFLLNRVVHIGTEAQRRREVARYTALFGLNLVIVAASVPFVAGLLSWVLANRALELLGAKVVVTAALLLFNAYAYHHWVFRQPPVTTDPRVR